MSSNIETKFALNGASVSVSAPIDEVLIDTLRDALGTRSVRETCAIGNCGTCTILLDGKPVSSCILLTCQVDGHAVLTSEGLGSDTSIDPVQEAFVRNSAYQCSFCIPAMVLTAKSFLAQHPRGTIEDARAFLAGNLCRCGTYPEVLKAVEELLARSQQRVEGRR